MLTRINRMQSQVGIEVDCIQLCDLDFGAIYNCTNCIKGSLITLDLFVYMLNHNERSAILCGK